MFLLIFILVHMHSIGSTVHTNHFPPAHGNPVVRLGAR